MCGFFSKILLSFVAFLLMASAYGQKDRVEIPFSFEGQQVMASFNYEFNIKNNRNAPKPNDDVYFQSNNPQFIFEISNVKFKPSIEHLELRFPKKDRIPEGLFWDNGSKTVISLSESNNKGIKIARCSFSPPANGIQFRTILIEVIVAKGNQVLASKELESEKFSVIFDNYKNKETVKETANNLDGLEVPMVEDVTSTKVKVTPPNPTIPPTISPPNAPINTQANLSSKRETTTKPKKIPRTEPKEKNCVELMNDLNAANGKNKLELQKIISSKCALDATYSKLDGNVIDINIVNHLGGEIIFSPSSVEVMESSPQNGFYKLKINSREPIKIKIESRPDGRTYFLDFDPSDLPLNADTIIVQGQYFKVFNFSGGNEKKYLVVMENSDGLPIYEYPVEGDTVNILNSSIKSGKYKIKLFDSSRNEFFLLGGFEKKINFLALLIKISIAFVVLLLLIYLSFILYNQRQKDLQPSEEYLKKMKHNIKITPKANENVEANLQEEESTFPNNNQINPIQIKINRKAPIKNESSGQSYSLEQRWEQVAYIPEIVQRNPALYFPCALVNSHWKDTTISDAFIHERFAMRLNDFVFDDKRQLSLFRDQEIPEIGGFILGKVDKNEHQGKIRYQVILERFVDIEPETNNQYQIEFGPAAWSELVRSMDDVYKDQEYLLLGWFHTHPGHGLFLSQPDLNIHLTYFKEKYHIALELDSVMNERNPNFEFGIFTWKNNQTMNNAKDHLGSWFNWNEVRTWLKNSSKENYYK